MHWPYIGIELTQRPSKELKECQVDYKAPLSGSHYSYTINDENRLFLGCQSWWKVSTLTVTVTFSNGAWTVRTVCQ